MKIQVINLITNSELNISFGMKEISLPIIKCKLVFSFPIELVANRHSVDWVCTELANLTTFT